ncbi:DUF1189 family protein [soil metagenome]
MSTYQNPPPQGYPPENSPGMPPGMIPGSPTPPPPAGPRQFGALRAMVLAPAFFKPLYRDVARNWRGIGALYLLLLVAITGAITAAKFHYEVKKFARDDFPTAVQDVPPISIRDGVVSSPVKQPYEIVNKKTGEVFAVLDTTGTVTSLKDSPAMMLVTANELHYRDNKQIKIQDLSDIKTFDLDRQKLQRWMDVGAGWVGPGMFAFFLIFGFIYRLIQALIYALFGLAFAAMFKARLSYQQLIRLAIISVTTVMLLDAALDVAGLHIPFFGFICFAITMVYLAVAVQSNADGTEYRPGGFEVYTPPVEPMRAP